MAELSHAALTAADSSTVLRDKTIPGLHTRGKRFFLYYRTKGGKERRPKLGEYPVMSVAQARTVAKDMLLEIAKGGDPGTLREAAKARVGMADALDRFRKDHLSKRKRGEHAYAMIERALTRGDLARYVDEFTHDDMDALHSRLSVKAPVTANRTIAHLSAFFSKCERWKYRPPMSNPCRGVERNPERKRKRYAKPDEVAMIARLLGEAGPKAAPGVAFIYLLILSGARPMEIAEARWEWLRDGLLWLPDSKTGEKPVYLPPAAMEVIEALPRTSGTLTGIKSPKTLWKRIRREAGCPDLRIYDLRHSFASAALAAGYSLDQIGELLGHSSVQTTKRYAHLVDELAREAVARTAASIQANMQGETICTR